MKKARLACRTALWRTTPLALLALIISCGGPTPWGTSHGHGDHGSARSHAAPSADPAPSAPQPVGPSVPAPVAVQEPEPQDELLETLDIRTQKRMLLAESYLDRARTAFTDGRLADAQREVEAALSYHAQSEDALRLQDEIQVALGGTPVRSTLVDANEMLTARVQRLQMEAEATYERGNMLLADGEYAEAVGALRLARAHIEAAPYQVEWGDLPQRVAADLARAETARNEQVAADRASAELSTFDSLQAEEAALRAERQQRIDNLLVGAVAAFHDEDWSEALTLCEEILGEDPLHERARLLRDSANRASHELVDANFRAERLERFRRWLEEVEAARVPTSSIMTLPDAEFWAEITERRAHAIAFDAGTLNADQQKEEEENNALRVALSSTLIPGLRLEDETSLERALDQLRTNTDFSFVVTPAAIDEVDSMGVEFNVNLPHDLSVTNALKVITRQAGETVGYTVRYGTVLIATSEEIRGELVLKVHDIQDLTVPRMNFAGPEIGEIPLPESGAGFGLEEEEPQFGGVVGDPVMPVDPDNLVELIQTSIAVGTWEDEGVVIRYSNGFLTIKHTPEIQQQVYSFLQDMRRYESQVVTIEARFLTISKNFLQEIGVDFRGLDDGSGTVPYMNNITSAQEDYASLGNDDSGSNPTNPVAGAYYLDPDGNYALAGRTENFFDDPLGSALDTFGGLTMELSFLTDPTANMILTAVEKDEQSEELMSTTISVQNMSRGAVSVLDQISYIQDFDVEVAQASFIADPRVNVVSDGIVLDVTPTVSHNRRYITLEIQPTIATLLLPMPEYTSSLGGLTSPVTFQLPEMNIASVHTTVVIPDGGTVLIGGLKRLLNVDRRAEIPVLSEIPLLSFFFKQEGATDETSDTLVMLKAYITDVRESTAAL